MSQRQRDHPWECERTGRDQGLGVLCAQRKHRERSVRRGAPVCKGGRKAEATAWRRVISSVCASAGVERGASMRAGEVAWVAESGRGRGASGSVSGSGCGAARQHPLDLLRRQCGSSEGIVSGDGKCSVCGVGGARRRHQGQRLQELWSQEWRPVGASKVG